LRISLLRALCCVFYRIFVIYIAVAGIAKLLVADCETLAKVGLCCHFDSVIRPEAERIGAGVAV